MGKLFLVIFRRGILNLDLTSYKGISDTCSIILKILTMLAFRSSPKNVKYFVEVPFNHLFQIH